MKVWIDGKVVEGSEARIPVTDHGLLYGDGIFEGIRVYGGRAFRLDLHLARLATSARVIGLALPGGVEAMREIVLATARAFGSEESYVRLIVTRGEGALGVDPSSCPRPRVLCLVDAVRLFPAEKLEQGLELATATVRRPPADVLDPGVKSLNYLNNVLAKLDAKRAGADDALILNLAGAVAEASVANVFVAKDGELSTPPPCDGALAGITRRSVLELAAELGIPARERTLGRVDLLGADEVFLTGTGARIMPVRSLDGCPIGKRAPGPLTEQLTQAFAQLVHKPELGAPL
ncbi:MAG TPA: branched-chain-amino-acid transaminase [Myxococcota bacterium]|nr:branched-chain-amino-acid transaminase [Myxococcota bacterium]